MEKRRFSRITLNMAAELTVGDTVYSFNQVNNISVGGCSLPTAADVPQGAACRFWLPLDAAGSGVGVEVYGEIVRCEEHSVGVRFTRITPESLFHLHNLIRFNAGDPDRIEEEISERPGLV
jgi:hypothetical protein